MSGMIGSHQWTELVTSRQPRSGNTKRMPMGADLLSSLVNMSVAVALVFLLLVTFLDPPRIIAQRLLLVTILAAEHF